jgi:Arc/MetJ-type ribon-helix-helix transcriptional regulator
MQEHTGKARNARIAVRLSREDQHQVEQAAKTRGYANSSAFIRAAIRNELNGREEMTALRNELPQGLIAYRGRPSGLVVGSRRSMRCLTHSPKWF